MYNLRESDKHFLWSLFGATGVILFWRGIWEGFGSLPVLENPWVCFFVGLTMLTFSGMIFKEFDPMGGLEEGLIKMLHHVHEHPKRHEFTIQYYDKIKKKGMRISAKNLRHIETHHVSLHENGKEVFIPIHRISAIHQKGKPVWRN